MHARGSREDSPSGASGGSGPEAAGEATGALLERLRAGDADAQAQLFVRIYDELHGLASRYMESERSGHTLQATALVHEAFARLTSGRPTPALERAQFFHAAARAMRQVLIDRARGKQRLKRAGLRVELHEEPSAPDSAEPAVDVLALEEGLAALEAHEPDLARLVEMRFFAGLEPVEIAALRGQSERTVRRDLQFARAWLRRRLNGEGA